MEIHISIASTKGLVHRMHTSFAQKLTLFEGQGIGKSAARPQTQSPKRFNTGKTYHTPNLIPFDVSYSTF